MTLQAIQIVWLWLLLKLKLPGKNFLIGNNILTQFVTLAASRKLLESESHRDNDNMKFESPWWSAAEHKSDGHITFTTMQKNSSWFSSTFLMS